MSDDIFILIFLLLLIIFFWRKYKVYYSKSREGSLCKEDKLRVANAEIAQIDIEQLNLYKVYYLSTCCEFYESFLTTALLFKWLQEEKIIIQENNICFTGKIIDNLDKEKVNLIFNDDFEENLYIIFLKMAKKNQDSFNSVSDFFENDKIQWFEGIIFEEMRELFLKEDLIIKKDDNFEFTQKFIDMVVDIAGFKKFLFSKNELKKECLDIEILEKYLIYAALFGNPKEIIEALKDIGINTEKYENLFNLLLVKNEKFYLKIL